MKKFTRLLFALALFSGPVWAGTPYWIYCIQSNGTLCNTTSDPGNGSIGDPAYLFNGKTNANFSFLSPLWSLPANSLAGNPTSTAGSIGYITAGPNITISGGQIGTTSAGGSVSVVSVVSANGLSGSVANPTTTPAITFIPTFSGIVFSTGSGFQAAIPSNFPTFNQNTSGNAATATQLLNTPTNCSSAFIVGITVSGNAVCNSSISPTMAGNWTFTASTGNLRIAPGATYAGGWLLVDGQGGGHSYVQMSGYCNGAAPGVFSLYDSSAGLSRECLSATGNWTFEAPTTGSAVTVNGFAGASTLLLNSSTTATGSDLVVSRTAAGTANTLNAGSNIILQSTSSNGTLLQNSGGQSEIWQSNLGTWNQVAYWNTNRGFVLDQPASGVGLTVNEVPGASTAATAAVSAVGAVAASGDNSSVSFYPGTGSAIRWPSSGDGYIDVPGTTSTLHLRAGGRDTFDIGYTGTVIVAAPTNGSTLEVSSAANGFGVSIIGSSTSGQSDGLLIQAGTTSADLPISVVNYADTTELFSVAGNGGVQIGSPAAGNKGPGTLNAVGLFVGGIAAVTPTVGTASLTYSTGCTTGSATASIAYAIEGQMVSFRVTSVTSCTTTSSSAIAMAGLPASMYPTANVYIPAMVLDNGVLSSGYVIVTTAGLVDILLPNNGTFSGTSGLNAGDQISWQLN